MADSKELPVYMFEFIDSLATSGRKKGTIKQYTSDLNPFLSWLHALKKEDSLESFKSLSPADISSYFQELKTKGYTAATIRRLGTVINRLRHFYGLESLGVIHEISETEPLRNLTEQDFINDLQLRKLIRTVKAVNPNELTKAASRNVLIDRNLSIVYLMRYYGLTPSEIHQMNMKDLNLGQGSLSIRGLTLLIKDEHIKPLSSYLHSIPELFRPKYNSADPVFVAFNNVSMSFQYDYLSGQPKRLSVRAIQSMLQKEMNKAGLIGLSALHLRNSCILDALDKGQASDSLATYFGMVNPHSLRRYMEFRKSRE